MLDNSAELRRRLALRDHHDVASTQMSPLLVVGSGVSIAATAGAAGASFAGLLWLGFVKCKELAEQRGLKRLDAPLVEQQLRTGRIQELLDAASTIESTLRRAGGSVYKNWLAECVGDLTVVKPDIIKALVQLDLPFCTTNHDSLLEEVLTEHTLTAWQAVTWQDHQVAEALLLGKLTGGGVLHLHGHWREPDSVILGRKSYSRLLDDQRAQAALRDIYRNRDLIFVGMGRGLDDPNFDALLDWAAELKLPEERFHSLLVREQDLSFFSKRITRTMRLNIICYGREYADLIPFLQQFYRKPLQPTEGGHQRSESLNARVRWLLFETLPTDSDFEAFCQDYFETVRRRFANNMDRVAKTTLLLDLALASEVLARLEEAQPARLGRLQASLLKRKQTVWSALLRLDRYHQWGELLASLQTASPAHVSQLLLIHGDDTQNLGLFIRRIEDHLAEDARCTVIQVPLRMSGITASSGAEWCNALCQTLAIALSRPPASLASLLERATSDTTLVLTLVAQANPLRILRTLTEQQEAGLRAFLCEGLPQALCRVRRLVVLLPIEHGSDDLGLLTRARAWIDEAWRTEGRQSIELEELRLPTWGDVEKYLRTYPEQLPERNRFIERVRQLYQSMATQQTTFEALASALDDQILIHT